MKCFYHVDLDGKCSAALVKKYVYGMSRTDTIEFRQINYGWVFPFEDIEKDEVVYIVDFSISPEDMEMLLDITENVIWIDHHKTAIDKYATFSRDIAGIRHSGIAGCALTCLYLSGVDKNEYSKYLNNQSDCPYLPKYVKYIADKDIWEWKFGDTTEEFCLGLSTIPNNPEDIIWDSLWNDDIVNSIIEKGKTISAFKTNMAKSYLCKAFDTEIDGFKVKAMNVASAIADSKWFAQLDNLTDYDILSLFSYNGTKWTYTLYSSTVDVSEIAKERGGGGHAGAAAFSTPELIFHRIEPDEAGTISDICKQ